MQVKGGTNAKGKVEITTTINLKPTEVKLQTGGKILLKLPGLNLRIPSISIKLWFFPIFKLGGFNINTELSPIEINLDSMVVNTTIAATGVEINAKNELDVDATVSMGAEGALTAGPLST